MPNNKSNTKSKIIEIFFLTFLLLFSSFTIISADDFECQVKVINIISDESVIEGDTIPITVRVKNEGGDIPSGEIIKVTLTVDGELIDIIEYEDGLSSGAQLDFNFSWIAELGDDSQRTLKALVEYDGENHHGEKLIEVIERNVDLTFDFNYGTDGMNIDGQPRVGEPISISAIAKNIGKNTTAEVNATLFMEENSYQSIIIDGLSKGETYTLNFEWIPEEFGNIDINITLDPNKNINEQYEDNNYLEKNNVNVGPRRLSWWNNSWHYRKVFRLSGTGNSSKDVNFTEWLNDLGINNEIFEDDTIRIVKYNVDGDFVEVVDKSWFNESNGFNQTTNATGEMSWFVNGDFFYCVYFDVDINSGIRTPTDETLDMNLSNQGISTTFEGSVEGWWTNLTQTLNNYYYPNPPIDDTMSIEIETMANASSVLVDFYRNGVFFATRYLNSNDDISWYGNDSFAFEGNWSLIINATDNAGYFNNEITHEFYVGYPDLTATSLDIYSASSEYGIYYEGTDINIDATVLAFNVTLENVNVTLKVNDTVEDYTNVTVEKDKERVVNFVWTPRLLGDYNICIEVDPNDEIYESNPNNNSISKNITIEGRPDLGVVNISYPSEPVQEGEPVIFYANITNTGVGNALHYRINLYVEQNDLDGDGACDDDVITYSGLKNHTFVNVSINQTVNISLVWDAAEYGSLDHKWVVGVLVVSNSSNPDSDIGNNSKSSIPNTFEVLGIEKEMDDPVIYIYSISDHEFEMSVEIKARITDDDGIDNVSITITNPPKNETYEGYMSKQNNNIYNYIFKETEVIGRYNFTITAIDKSEYENQTTKTSYFIITTDKTPPKIEYFDVSPSVQLVDEKVKINCIVSDRYGIKSVFLTIKYPDEHSEIENITNMSQDGEYEYIQTFDDIGKYEVTLDAEDNYENENTDKVEFWITNNLDDIDSDGMPNQWEERYGFDPYDPTDADEDADGDGYTNLEEYENKTDPLKSPSEEGVIDRILDNGLYIVVSFISFLFILSLSVYGIWRRKK